MIFPGFDGGAEWGGSAFDPDTGILYVNSNDIAWTGDLAENTGNTSSRQAFTRASAASAIGDDMTGSPPQFPSLTGVAESPHSAKRSAQQFDKGRGRMPAFPNLTATELDALIAYVSERRKQRACQRRRSRLRSCAIASPDTHASSIPRAIPRSRRPGAR